MFNLIYRDGAPENTGHYEGLKTDGVSTYKVGQAVALEGGVAKLCGGDTNTKNVYGIVSEGAEVSDETVTVLKVERDMVFKCPVDESATLFKGQKLAIDGETFGGVIGAEEALAEGYIGATVADPTITDAHVEVRFEN